MLKFQKLQFKGTTFGLAILFSLHPYYLLNMSSCHKLILDPAGEQSIVHKAMALARIRVTNPQSVIDAQCLKQINIINGL